MAFGKKAGSLKKMKADLKRSSGGMIQYIPKEDSMVVRFLDEPEEWVNYYEKYDPALKKGWPVPEDPDAPGNDPDLRSSSRYLVNAVRIEDDRVMALQLPKSLVENLTAIYEEEGTLIDRDFKLVRSGSGLDTTYTCIPQAPFKRDLRKYKRHELEEVLEAAYMAVWGDPSHDEDEDDEPWANYPARKPKPRRPVDDADDDEPPVKRPAKKAPARRRRR